MSNGEDIIKLSHELDSMPEYKLELKIKALDRSRYIFNQNYSQLRQLLLIEKDTEKAIKLWDVKNEYAHNAYRLEVTRLLHNFVASVKSLIDHSRTLYKDIYEKGNRFPDYPIEVKKRFAENPLAQFVEDLRDYCLHYQLPPIFSSMTYTRETQKMESTTRLDVTALEKSFKWSSLSKEYIEEQKNKIRLSSNKFNKDISINLLAIIEEYYSLVIDFHNWLLTHQRQIHSEEFNRLEAKKQELRQLLIPSEVGFALGEIERSKNPDEAFHRLLTPEERKQLELIPLNSIQHGDTLITMIRQQANISSELENRIKSAYQKYLI